MLTWFNPRIIAVALSLGVLLQVSKHDGYPHAGRRAVIVCAALLCAYIIAFIIPLWKAFGFSRIALPLLSLGAAWIATALALIADAVPVIAEEGVLHHYNWTMTAFCVAAAVAFYLFFENTSRGFRLRRDLSPTRSSEFY